MEVVIFFPANKEMSEFLEFTYKIIIPVFDAVVSVETATMLSLISQS